MTRPFASTTADLKALGELEQGYPFENVPDGFMEIPDLTKGMETATPRAQRNIGSAILIENGRTRFDWVGRRPANIEYITKPDSNRVLFVSGVKTIDGTWIVRVANGATHIAHSVSDSWVSVTLGSGASNYSSYQKLTAAQVLGFYFLATDGVRIQHLDLTAGQLNEVGEAPIAKFVTSFADRLIAAHVLEEVGGYNPVKVVWSENADPFDWTGQGAGEENLIQSPSDTGDEISGIFGMESVMVVLRERSIWHATRQPFAQAPLAFAPIITNQGCDMPYTAIKVPFGLIYADSETKAVWLYQIGARPRIISGGVDDVIFAGLVNPLGAEAVFDPLNQEYQLGVPTDSQNPWDITERWIYNLKRDSWVKDTSPTITAMGRAFDVGSPVTIDDLTGTTIDGLSPSTIDELSEIFDKAFLVLKGTSSGEVMRESFGTQDDLDTTAFDFSWISQNMNPISRRRTLQRARIKMGAESSGNTYFEFTTDLSSWTVIKSVADPSALEYFGFSRQFTKEVAMYLRIRSGAQEFKMSEAWIKMLEKGMGRVNA